MTNNQLVTRMKKHASILERERDRLRDLYQDVEALNDVAERAIDAIREAIEALSEEV